MVNKYPIWVKDHIRELDFWFNELINDLNDELDLDNYYFDEPIEQVDNIIRNLKVLTEGDK